MQILSVIVVGYANDVIDQFGGNSSIISAQFVGIGNGGKIDLLSIKCPDSAYGKIFLQTLKGDGSGKKMYNWTRKRVNNAWQYNWVDSDDPDTFPAQGVSFEPGEAFWLTNNGAEGVNTFNTSGEVSTNDVEIVLATDGDSILCGNNTPVYIDLLAIKCPDAAYGKIFLQTLKGDGSGKKMYNWTRKRVNNAWQYNWVDSDDPDTFPAQGVSFKPGQGFWVTNNGTEANAFTIKFPGVKLN